VLKLSYREIGLSVGAAPSGVCGGGWPIKRAEAAGLDWAAVEKLDDGELDARLYAKEPSEGRLRGDAGTARGSTPSAAASASRWSCCTWSTWRSSRDGYRYTQFCEIYRQWLSRQRLSMRQVYRAGEKLFIDYSGKKACIWDPTTGERIEVELFVAALGASNFTYAEATLTQRSRDWIASHVRTFEYMGGVAGAAGARPTSQRRHEDGLVRARDPADVRRDGPPLRHDGAAGAAAQATRQGEGRSGGADRPSAGSWPGCATSGTSRWSRSTRGSRSYSRI
jgi:hypothetical protein